MKKLFVIIMALIGLVSAQPIAKDMINRFLTFSVEEVLGEKVFDHVWEYVRSDKFRTSSFQGYHVTRSGLYENLGLEDGDYQSYVQGRTIIIARVKEHFFNGNNLKSLYLSVQPKFQAEVVKLTVEERQQLFLRLNMMKTTFEEMGKPERQALWKKFFRSEQYPKRESDEAQKMLVANLSAKEIAEKIQSGGALQQKARQTDEDLFVAGFEDESLAKFAGRRFGEGGNSLLQKYIAVIDLAIADVK